jgi:hypothetical protein
MIDQMMNLRCLSVSQQTFLLLELLNLLLIGRLRDELIDVGEVSLSRNIETSILLSETITPSGHFGMRSEGWAVWAHAFGNAMIHL